MGPSFSYLFAANATSVMIRPIRGTSRKPGNCAVTNCLSDLPPILGDRITDVTCEPERSSRQLYASEVSKGVRKPNGLCRL